MHRSLTIATLTVLLACSGSGVKDGYTKAADACDQTCADPAQGGSLSYVGGRLCGNRWTCRCALAGEDEASVCDPIVRVGVISDTYLSGDATAPSAVFTGEAAEQMAPWKPHLLAHAGDMIGSRSDYRTYLDTLLAAYALPGVPRLLLIGDKDVTGGPLSIDVIRNALPLDASSWLQPGQMYGSFDLKGVHFVTLDATYQETEPATHYGLNTGTYNRNGYIPHVERDWLVADLAATKLPTVIFIHPGTGVWNPTDPSTRLDNADELMGIFEANRGKVAAVINGHANAPFYATVNGIHYFTVEAMIPERFTITEHDRGVHSQLEVNTELERITYTIWENDSAKGYLEVKRYEMSF